MKQRILTVAIVFLAAAALLHGLMQRSVRRDAAALAPMASLPVLEGGRVKPLDTVARNTLLLMRGKQHALAVEGGKVPALEWFLTAVLAPGKAAEAFRVFRVDHPDLLALLEAPQDKPFHFTYAELERFFGEIERQARRIDPEAPQRTPFEKALLHLRMRLIHYQTLAESFAPPEMEGSVAERYLQLRDALAAGWASKDPHSVPAGAERDAFLRFLDTSVQVQSMATRGVLLLVPPESAEDSWRTVGRALMDTTRVGSVDAVSLGYARIADALNAGNPVAVAEAVQALRGAYEGLHDTHPVRVVWELRFNRFDPGMVSMQLYVLAALVALAGMLVMPAYFQKIGLWIVLISFLVHTGSLAMRVYLTGYAPVTNLYSSAVYVGWGAVFFGLFLERGYRNGLGNLVSASIGFCSLLVAHHLAASSGNDTMEMMRAVLDSNFWLSTHVLTITIGYSAVFLAGFLGIVHLLRTRFGGLDAATGQSLERMVYGVTAAALFFSFIGTVLGGIWADQSWGRFWGWDPKENGALLIVIWTALLLHAIRIRMFSVRMVMALAVIGNVVTSWAWFGVNMLGIGLHSYGFMDEAFRWLLLFWLSQGAIIGLAYLPRRRAAAAG